MPARRVNEIAVDETMRSFLAAALMIATTAPALAGATGWVDVAPGARVRLVSSDTVRPDGTMLMGIEADMPDTTRTYWRTPGESGIPTQMALGGSTGVADAQIHWPYPVIDTSAGVVDYVYFGHTVLPLTVRVTGDHPVARARVTMGICSDVCVPVRADFTLALSPGHPDAAESIRLRQALASTPVPWPGPADVIGPLRYDAAADALRLSIDPAQIAPMSVVADVDDAAVLFGAPQKGPDNRDILLPLLGSPPIKGLGQEAVHLTFMTPGGPYETVRPIETGG